MEAYDRIAEEYRDSKQLSFREYLERHTLLQLLGEVRGKTVLDMACGEGFYTRLLRRAGASEVTGGDISAEMIRLAQDQERRQPLGCKYLQADAAAFRPAGPVDLVVAMYLLNYARTAEQFLVSAKSVMRRCDRAGAYRRQRQRAECPDRNGLLEEIRPGAILFQSGGRGRRHPLHHHQCRWKAVPVRQLLPQAGDLRGRVPRPDSRDFAGWMSGCTRPRRAILSGTIS